MCKTKYIKIIHLILLLIALILLLSACSLGTASESDIKDEITSFEQFDKADMSITSYSETKRQTNSKNKSDIVWVSIIAENDIIEYKADYNLNYTKYNNGWILDYIICERSTYSAKKLVDEDTIKNDVFRIYDYYIDQYNLYNIELEEPILLESYESGDIGYSPYCIFSISGSAENEYTNFNADFIMSYRLGLFDGWYYTEDVYHEYTMQITSEPKAPPEESLAEERLALSSVNNYSLESAQWVGNRSYEFTFNCTDDRYKYLEMHHLIHVWCDFDDVSGWYVSYFNSELLDVDINALGTWIYDDGISENKYIFNVVSVDSDQITFSYNVTFTDWLMALGTTTNTVSSNGETTHLDWEETSNAEYSLITTDYVVYHQFGLANSNYYYLEFRSFTGDRYDESGFYFNDCQLIQQP